MFYRKRKKQKEKKKATAEKKDIFVIVYLRVYKE